MIGCQPDPPPEDLDEKVKRSLDEEWERQHGDS